MTAVFADYAEAARQGVLPVQHCTACGYFQFALAGRSAAIGRCRRCRRPDPPWVAADGAATLISFTVVHGRPPAPGEPAPTHVAGIAQLIEGPWVHGAIDAPPDALVIGMALRATVAAVQPGAGDAAIVPVPTLRAADSGRFAAA